LGLSLRDFEALPAEMAEEWLVAWDLIEADAARRAARKTSEEG
jgi:hypothetical protein